MNFESDRLGFKSLLCHLPVVSPWVGYLTPRSLSILICVVGMLTPLCGVCEKWMTENE